MKKRLVLFLFLLYSPLIVQAQQSDNLGVWIDHLPYKTAVDIAVNKNRVFVACNQAFFVYDKSAKTIRRFSKVNGLSDVGLTDIAWSNRFKLLMIGYENGNLDILQGEEVTNFPDVRLTANYSGLKRINHINMSDSTAYISTDFGILEFDLAQRLIRQTYIIGPNGTILSVNQTATGTDSLYAATDMGLYKADLESAKFIFQNWQRDAQIRKEVDNLAYFDEKIFVNRNNPPNSDSIYYRENGNWEFFEEPGVGNTRDIRASQGQLTFTNNFAVRAYQPGLSLTKNFNGGNLNDSIFNPVSAVLDESPDNFWVADGNRGLSFIYKTYSQPVVPNSPKSQNAFSLFTDDTRLYVSPGGFTEVIAPVFNNEGFFTLKDHQWNIHDNQQFGGYKDIVDIVSDPSDPDHFYASSYGNGILEFRWENGQPIFQRIINEQTTNGAMPAFNSNGDHRVSDMDTDEEGNIWFTNSLTNKPLGIIRSDGSVETYGLGSVSGGGILDIMATSEGQVWVQIRNNGIVVATFENGQIRTQKLSSTEGSGNLPSETVNAYAEDRDGEIWIGTNEGLGVLFSPQNIFEPERSYDASILVIDENDDGNGERVLGAQDITDIEVDGSNKKWFATSNSGVFYTSENGREQLQHFTTQNSPLPSDNVLDMDIDNKTGRVYFATDQGIVAYQGQATEGVENMTDVFAYPNPVKPNYEGPILIRGLVTNAQVKITDVAGNIVFETVAEGGQAIWSGRDFSGQRVKSGVYLAYITNDLGSKTKVAKILIIN